MGEFRHDCPEGSAVLAATGGTEPVGIARDAMSFVADVFDGPDVIADGANEDMMLLLLYGLCPDVPNPETASSIGNFRRPSLWKAVSEMKVGTTSA